MKLFLSHAGMGEVVGGVEVYASHMEKVFPDLELIDYHSLKEELGDALFPLAREPERAKRLGDYINKNYPDAEHVFTNGMFCWNLNAKSQFNICHGTYSAFAQGAVPKTSPDYYRLKYIYSHFEKKAAKNAKVVVSNSKQAQMNAMQLFGVESEIIYPPVDFDVFREASPQKAKKSLEWEGVNALFVGRPEKAKGFDFVESLAAKNPQIMFRCILSRPYSSALKNIDVIGAVSHSDLPDYYNAADVVLVPSRFEGFGMVTAEALACSKKTVCLKTGLAAELKSQNLYVAEPNFASFSEKFMQALSTDAAISQPALKSMFSLEKFVKKWRALVG